MKRTILPILLISSFLQSCQQAQPKVYGTFDPAAKTIAVPVKGYCFNAKLKEELRKKGWIIKIDGATHDYSPKGHINATSKYTVTINEFSSTGDPSPCYRATPGSMLFLFPVWGQIIWAVRGCPPITYKPASYCGIDCTIFENRTGNELLTYHSEFANVDKAAELIIKAIEKNYASSSQLYSTNR